MEEKKIEWAIPALVELGNAGYTFGALCNPGTGAVNDCTDGSNAVGTCGNGTGVTAVCTYGIGFV